MFKLGLTGSIATGKSTALKVFADLGYPTFSADEAVHELYQNHAIKPVAKLFPQALVNRRIDRAILGAILAKNPERLKHLEAVVHPLVRKQMKNFLASAEASGAKLAVIDVPLLYETGFDYGLDAVALTFCDESQLRARALARPGMDVEKLNIILARQISQDEKKQRADYLIDTGASLEHMHDQVKQIIAAIVPPSSK